MRPLALRSLRSCCAWGGHKAIFKYIVGFHSPGKGSWLRRLLLNWLVLLAGGFGHFVSRTTLPNFRIHLCLWWHPCSPTLVSRCFLRRLIGGVGSWSTYFKICSYKSAISASTCLVWSYMAGLTVYRDYLPCHHLHRLREGFVFTRFDGYA